MRVRNTLFLSIVLFTVACASPPPVAPVKVGPLAPKAGERVDVNQSILIIDTSASISDDFPGEKALVQSLVASMPDGSYEAGSISYGGFRRETVPVSGLDRNALGAHARDLSHLAEGSPLYAALAEAGGALAGKNGHAAITVVTDGLPTDVGGREVPAERTLAAGRALAAGYDGTLCIHTIQVGSDPAGSALLDQLSKTTDCGSSQKAGSLMTAAAIQSFQRDVYFGAAPVARRAAPADTDGDGVIDSKDECPTTPRGTKVDARGCWVQGLLFETNSAEIKGESKRLLDTEVVPVLSGISDKVSIDGHTDSRGAAEYNQALSERRARAVRDYLVSKGIAADRLRARGFGETKPVAPNNSPENMRKNRRTELNPFDE